MPSHLVLAQAALHLALIQAGIQPGDEVAVSTLTFAASAFPIVYLGAKPVFIDSEPTSWNMDPVLLAEWLYHRAKRGKHPKAVVLVHLYGQTADVDPILALCQEYGIALIEDAAEALRRNLQRQITRRVRAIRSVLVQRQQDYYNFRRRDVGFARRAADSARP